MSKVFEGVVDTCSKEERLELINYVSSKVPCISVVNDFKGFSSVEEFIDYCEGK